VHMGIDEPGHYQAALGIDEFCLGVFGAQLGRRSDHGDSRTPDGSAAVGNERKIGVPCDKFSVSDEKHFCHSLEEICCARKENAKGPLGRGPDSDLFQKSNCLYLDQNVLGKSCYFNTRPCRSIFREEFGVDLVDPSEVVHVLYEYSGLHNI